MSFHKNDWLSQNNLEPLMSHYLVQNILRYLYRYINIQPAETTTRVTGWVKRK